MADNTTLDAGTGGDTIASDDIGGVKYQRVKLVYGADGTTLGDVSTANAFPVTIGAAVVIAGPVTVSGSVSISGPTTVTGSVSIAGPTTVTGTVAATQSGAWAITQASVVGQVSIVGAITIGQHTISGTVSLAGGSVGIAGPVTVSGTVAATQSGAWSISATSNIANLLGATVVAGATVVGTVGIAKRVDTQATVGSAVNTATPMHVNEFGSLWVVSEAGDAQTTNGGGVTGINVFLGNGTVLGAVSVAGGSVGIAGPVTVTGSVTSAITGPVTVTGTVAATQSGAWSISATSNIANLLGASVNEAVTVVGTIAIAKRSDAASTTVGATVGAATPLQVDEFGKLWITSDTLGIAGPVTVTGSVTSAITGPVTVTGTVAATQSGSWSIAGPSTVTGAVSVVGQISIVGAITTSQHTISGTVSLAGGSVGIAGPVTVSGTVTAALAPQSTGGLTTFRSMTLGSVAVTVSAAAASLHGMWVTNTSTATSFVKLYNTVAAQTGSTTPLVTLGIPGNATDDIAGLFGSTHGIAFSNAIMAAATTGISDTASVGAASGDILINLFYK